MIRRPPRSTLDRSSAASDVYKRQALALFMMLTGMPADQVPEMRKHPMWPMLEAVAHTLSLIHISEPTRPY